MSTATAPTLTPDEARRRRRGIAVGLGVSGLAVLLSILLFLFVVGPSMGMFVLPPSPQQYGDNVLTRVEGAGLTASGDAWEAAQRDARARLAGATTIEEAQAAVAPALRVAGSSLLPAGAQPAPAGPVEMPAVTRTGTVITVRLPSLVSADGVTQAQYADAAFQGVKDKLGGACGVVVDLRGSDSRALWWQLAAVAGVLPQGKVLTVEDKFSRRDDIRVAGTGIEYRGSVRASTGPLERRPLAVAVLVDAQTRNDAAVVARAFVGADSTRLFGEPTRVPLVTEPQRLHDGAVLDVAVARYLDRAGSADPVVPVSGTADDAPRWLTSQCG